MNAEETYMRGIHYQQRGEWDEAAKWYLRAIRQCPDWPEAIHNLGWVWKKRYRLPDAVRCFRKALALNPHNPVFYNNLGNALFAMNEPMQAIEAFTRALSLNPGYTYALFNLSRVYRRQGRIEAAMAACRKAIALDPTLFKAHHDLGMMFKEKGEFNRACDCLLRALHVNPDSVEARLNLANVYEKLLQWDDAKSCLKDLIHRKPDSYTAFFNLGNICRQTLDYAQAEAYLKQAIGLKPDFTAAHFNLSQVLLARGKMIQGWQEYEWRLKKSPPFTYTGHMWRGEPLNGKTLLVKDEQGIGDVLQFIRFLPLLQNANKDAKIIFQTRKTLSRLIRSSPCLQGKGIQLLENDATVDHHDATIPLLSLPGLFGVTNRNLPADIPYVLAEAGLENKWKTRLRDVEGFRIGICWQGNPSHKGDRIRSVPLAMFYDLVRIPGIRVFSLQKFDGVEHLTEVPDNMNIINLDAHIDCGTDAFVDTAAVMKNLDLVITIDSALGHLAGAMGIRTWLILSNVPDWRWGLTGDRSPWYPTIRIFRQAHHGQWGPLFRQIVDELALMNRTPIVVQRSIGESVQKT